MNDSLKNPCHECDHHLSGGNKNCDRCISCEKRIAYVNAIGTSPSSTVSEHVDLDGHGGADLSNINIEDLPGPKTKQDLADYETVEKTSSGITKDPIDKHIKQVCESAGMTVDYVRAGVLQSFDKIQRYKFHKVRDQIIKDLASGKFGGLNQTQIGDYLNIKNWNVSDRMKNMGISPRPKKKKPAKSPNVGIGGPPSLELQKNKSSKTITISFEDHPDIFDDLIKLSKEQLRKPENQVLWILIKIHETGMTIPDRYYPDK